MKKSIQPILLLLLIISVSITMTACSDFDEMKSQRALIQAETLIEKGDEVKAEQALSVLIARYPNTQAGETAGRYLVRIQKQREFRERREFAKILDSYQQVLKGYHATFAEYPRSLAAFEQSEYFFDAAYLDGITPAGYQVYLWLKDDGSGYRAWCVSPDKERGYAVEADSRQLVPFNRDEMVANIKGRFLTIPWSDKLVALQAKR